MKKKILLMLILSTFCIATLAGCTSEPNGDNTTSETESDVKEDENIEDTDDGTENEDTEGSENADTDNSDSSGETEDTESSSSSSSGSEESTKVAIVQVNGTVDAAEVTAVETVFTGLVNKLRENGLISATDICVTIDETSIKFDITPNNSTVDLTLYKTDVANSIYTFALDQNLWYLEGLGEKINGIDPAPYNKEAIYAMLGLISTQPEAIFNVIDQTYFSCYSLSTTEWTAVGDCQMMDGGDSVSNAWSYIIKKGQ